MSTPTENDFMMVGSTGAWSSEYDEKLDERMLFIQQLPFNTSRWQVLPFEDKSQVGALGIDEVKILALYVELRAPWARFIIAPRVKVATGSTTRFERMAFSHHLEKDRTRLMMRRHAFIVIDNPPLIPREDETRSMAIRRLKERAVWSVHFGIWKALEYELIQSKGLATVKAILASYQKDLDPMFDDDDPDFLAEQFATFALARLTGDARPLAPIHHIEQFLDALNGRMGERLGYLRDPWIEYDISSGSAGSASGSTAMASGDQVLSPGF
ncbi:hypothetical protein [Ensifer aridi]|uniref:hypothetical protein n=1 Tax=Ensifer aridi TaxID=1708715 RepID=UPI0015E3BA6D|nr:hypothetical protein [Ensifer aridi]